MWGFIQCYTNIVVKVAGSSHFFLSVEIGK